MTYIDWHDQLTEEIAQLRRCYPSPSKFVSYVDFPELCKKANLYIPPDVTCQLNNFISKLYTQEDFCHAHHANIIPYSYQGAQERDRLLAIRHRLQDPEKKLQSLRRIILECITEICEVFPNFSPHDVVTKKHRVIEFADVPELAVNIIRSIATSELSYLFHTLGTQLEANLEPPNKPKLPAVHKFQGTPEDIIQTYFRDTPLLDLFYIDVPFAIPGDIYYEQNKLPYDPDHPKHYCHQCHKPLPPDFAQYPWQELSYPRGPFFHTEHCKMTTLNRHRTKSGYYEDAYASVVKEYESVSCKYEDTKRLKEAEQLNKEQLRLQREREAREERDYKEWQRDQQRSVAQWEKEKDAEQHRLAEEAAYQESIATRPVPEAARGDHTAIIAGTGWGKTQLLESIIAEYLQQLNPPSLVVVDSTGAITDRIQKLRIFNERLRNRILIVDPAQAPSLNIFDYSNPRFSAYTDDQREDLQVEIAHLFNYIFSSTNYDLSGQMGGAFIYALKLMMKRKGSTLRDLRDLLQETPRRYEDSAFKDDIDRLDPDSLDFFKHQFYADTLRATRASIARRIHTLLGLPAFRRMFTASANALDLYTEMNRGAIVLVNTNIKLLKEDGMVLFGRYIIAKALEAAFERADIPQLQRKQAYLIVDEAAPYFDDTFERLLTRARQYKLGFVIAFQHLEQTDNKLRSAIASCTRVKYAGGLGAQDRRRLAEEMETTPEFLASLKKDLRDPDRPEWSQFACYVRPDFSTACLQTVQFYQLENMPRMTDTEHEALLARNRERLSPPETHDPLNEGASRRLGEVPAEADKPKQSEQSQDASREAALSEPTHKSTSTVLDQFDPGEPSSDWKP